MSNPLICLINKTPWSLKQATPGSSGYDLRVANEVPVSLKPGKIALVKTGLWLEMPPGLEAQIRPRSSMARKGILVPNAPGTVDSDYRGEVKVLLMNVSKLTYVLKQGARIAQLVFAKVEHPDIIEVEHVGETERGEGGFGSTGE